MEIRKMPKADIEMGYQGERLVQITIRPTTDDDDGQLGYEELAYAARQIQDFARTEYRTPMMQSRPTSKAAEEMVNAYNDGKGRVTDEYLARLAVAYEELAPQGRSVSTALTNALNSKLPTVKGHIMRARREGFLTEAIEGREGGEATTKARELIAGLEHNEIERLKAEAETWRRLAAEMAEAADERDKQQSAQPVT